MGWAPGISRFSPLTRRCALSPMTAESRLSLRVGGDAKGFIEHFAATDWNARSETRLRTSHSLLSGSAISRRSCPTARSVRRPFSESATANVLLPRESGLAASGTGSRPIRRHGGETGRTRWSATLVPFSRPRTSRRGEERVRRVACASLNDVTYCGETVEGARLDHWDDEAGSRWPIEPPTSGPTSRARRACLAIYPHRGASRLRHSDAFDVTNRRAPFGPHWGCLVRRTSRRAISTNAIEISAGMARVACSSAHFCLANGSVISSPVCGITRRTQLPGMAWPGSSPSTPSTTAKQCR